MIDEILASYEDETFLKADGFDDAIIGVDSDSIRLIYSIKKCIIILQSRDGLPYSEALDYFNFNVKGGYMGEKTPIWCEDDFDVPDTVEVSSENFDSMQKDIQRLRALEGAGVDNWEGYEIAMETIEDDEDE